jgi:hypothetical protein
MKDWVPSRAVQEREMFEKWKARNAEREAVAAQRATDRKRADDQHVLDLYDWSISRAKSIADGSFSDAGSRVALKKGERAIYNLDGVGLVESRKGPGHWQGRNQGISVHVPGTRSMRYRVGATKGTYVQGEEKPTLIDSGTVTVTTTRAVFVGSKQTREWAWSKLIAVQDDDPGWLGIAVENRQKVSGISYPNADARLPLQLAVDMAVAAQNGTAAQYVSDLERQRAEHVSAGPAASDETGARS